MAGRRIPKLARAAAATLVAWALARAADAPAAATPSPAVTADGRDNAASAAPPPAPPAAPAPATDLSRLSIRRGDAPATQATAAADVPQAPSLDGGNVGMALAAVIGLILCLRWGSRKLLALPAPGRTSHLMQVVARTSLAPRQQVLLVRVGRRLMVVGDSGGALSALGQITDADEVAALLGQAKSAAAPAVGTASFGGVLRRLANGSRNRDGGGSAGEEEPEAHEEADRPAERRRLFDGFPDEPRAADDESAPTPVDGDHDSPPRVGLDEVDAQAAVEAARLDIQSLRDRLRQVTQRLGGPDGADRSKGGEGPTIA